MKIAIMQPYFLPYIGYFQLIKSVDLFVVYDNIKYTKKGWINRNRILINGRDEIITIPIKKDSDYLNINQRCLSDDSGDDLKKIFNKIIEAYRKAPFYPDVIELFREIFFYPEKNLFKFIKYSLNSITDFLSIQTPIIDSSTIEIDHSLKSELKVIAICKQQQATCYINPIGGLELYSRQHFFQHQIDLKFIQSKPILYKQFGNVYVPWLSIIDVMMFNHKDECLRIIENEYQLVNNE